jgi:hypothetical protein
MLKKPLFIIAAITMGVFPAVASAKVARCVITSEGERFVGPCRFSAEPNGTFSIEPIKPRHHILGATLVTVAMKGDGTADVRGLTDAGINSRWGDVRRSRTDRACWVGDRMKICAY